MAMYSMFVCLSVCLFIFLSLVYCVMSVCLLHCIPSRWINVIIMAKTWRGKIWVWREAVTPLPLVVTCLIWNVRLQKNGQQ